MLLQFTPTYRILEYCLRTAIKTIFTNV